MSTTTTNYGLIKPELTDAADITAMNENWNIIDAELKNRATLVNDKIPVEQLPSGAYVPIGLIRKKFIVSDSNDMINALNQAVDMLEVETMGFFIMSVTTEGLGLSGGTWQLNVCKQRSGFASVVATSYQVGGTVSIMCVSKYENAWGTWTNWVGNVSTAVVG
jgi:hypothetical protein